MNNDYFVFTIDTEWDRKDNQSSVTVENIRVLQDLHDICVACSIKPTYMCSYEVITSQLFEDFLSRNDIRNFEVGAHLHPWTTPPLTDIDDAAKKPYPTEYSNEVFCHKLQSLTQAFKDRGIVPTSYRAGRFGFDQKEHTSLLLAEGYKVESSVTPGIDWSGTVGYREGGPDFSAFNRDPYFIDSGDLLEVPVTVFVHNGRNLWLRPLLHPKKLGPFRYGSFDAQVLKQLSLEKLEQEEGNVLHMFMHSNELDPNTNPYFNTKKKVASLMKFLKEYFMFLNLNNVNSCTLSELHEQESGKRNV